ncbi:MAG: transcriptional repressor NrdR [Lentisphaeraceae bacterium]|nr:transcriptional repressor NrdR [Lentisphaeraceae bacterium]
MRCPECDCSEDKVLETRVSKNKTIVRRRRQCVKCGFRFNTQEEVIRTEYIVTKSDGRREERYLQKLRNGLNLACRKRPVTSEQLDMAMDQIKKSLEKNFDREVPSKEIGKLVMESLKAIDEVAYVRFASVYRNFKDTTEFIEEIKAMYSN